MAPVQVIDLTGGDSDDETPNTIQQSGSNDFSKKRRRDHAEFWAREESGPQRHGPRRMRNIAMPQLGDNCPFLELPPEVRNRIYEYALGGHNLHMFVWKGGEKPVNYQTRSYRKTIGTRWSHLHQAEVVDYAYFRVQYVLCQCPGSDDEAYQKSLFKLSEGLDEHGRPIDNPRSELTPFTIKTYEQRHEKCFDLDVLKYATVGMRKLLTTPRLAMGLLRTCKQIHHEAALVPYYDNTFSFARGSDLEFFINDVLSEKQRAAVQHIAYAGLQDEARKSGGHAVRTYLKTHFHDDTILRGLVPKTLDLLSGLAKLTISIDADSNVPDWRTFEQLWDRLPRFTRKELKFEVLVRLEGHYAGRWIERIRQCAEEVEFGLARSAQDVPSHREARQQLEYAQMQAAHLEHEKRAITVN